MEENLLGPLPGTEVMQTSPPESKSRSMSKWLVLGGLGVAIWLLAGKNGALSGADDEDCGCGLEDDDDFLPLPDDY